MKYIIALIFSLLFVGLFSFNYFWFPAESIQAPRVFYQLHLLGHISLKSLLTPNLKSVLCPWSTPAVLNSFTIILEPLYPSPEVVPLSSGLTSLLVSPFPTVEHMASVAS